MIAKVVVFDLDETLGYFTQLGVLFDTIETFTNEEIPFELFCKLFDLYKDIFRINIFSILNYLKRIKTRNNVKIMIYTNNQGDKKWCINIIKYIEHKISYNLFDHIIHAYKVGNKVVEHCRTSHDKKYSDLIKCAKLSDKTKVCFIDDQYHPYMKHKNVYYINIKPYTFKVNNEIFCNTFFESEVFDDVCKEYNITDSIIFKSYIQDSFKNIKFISDTTDEELKVDKILAKKIMYHIQKFISRRNVTRKNKPIKTNNRKTRKQK
jgi:hypothetical protein